MSDYGLTDITWLVVSGAFGVGLWRVVRLLTDIRDRLADLERERDRASR